MATKSKAKVEPQVRVDAQHLFVRFGESAQSLGLYLDALATEAKGKGETLDEATEELRQAVARVRGILEGE